MLDPFWKYCTWHALDTHKANSQLAKALRQDFPGGPVLRLHTPNAGRRGLIPGQGTRLRMLQLEICTLQLKNIPHTATKIEDSVYFT